MKKFRLRSGDIVESDFEFNFSSDPDDIKVFCLNYLDTGGVERWSYFPNGRWGVIKKNPRDIIEEIFDTTSELSTYVPIDITESMKGNHQECLMCSYSWSAMGQTRRRSCTYVDWKKKKCPKGGDMKKYDLVGIDGNAFTVIGYVISCMKKEGRSKEDIAKYKTLAMSGDYDNVLCVSMDMIDELNGEL